MKSLDESSVTLNPYPSSSLTDSKFHEKDNPHSFSVQDTMDTNKRETTNNLFYARIFLIHSHFLKNC